LGAAGAGLTRVKETVAATVSFFDSLCAADEVDAPTRRDRIDLLTGLTITDEDEAGGDKGPFGSAEGPAF